MRDVSKRDAESGSMSMICLHRDVNHCPDPPLIYLMMADDETIFEDGENLQGAIGKALQNKKALLCFVSDDGDQSAQWEVALLEPKIRDKLRSSTVALRLKAGSEQAGYLNAVCPVQSSPAVIIIFNAQVVANYQNGQTSFEQLQQHLEARYGTSTEGEQASSSAKPVVPGYIDLPPPGGRMRLPSNAYDHFRKLTQQYISSGVSGKGLLHIQLTLLDSLNIDVVSAEVKKIKEQSEMIAPPDLSEEVTNRLLNTPASKMQANTTTTNRSSIASSSNNASATRPSTSQPQNSAPTAESPHPELRSRPASNAQPPPSAASSSTSTQSQRASYIATQKSAEAERTRIKAQIEADKRARRETDRKAREEALALQRRAELSALRKANSTTRDPKHTDVRIQVRLFDGATVRSSFAAEATIAGDVRPWIDGEVLKKAAVAGQPYDLKLILTPLPNRQIEAGEEDTPLSDIEGVKGSATMVMVPVKGYVESYGGGSGAAGVAGSVVGGVQSVVGTGAGLIGSAAGMLLGGLGRLVGAGSAPRDTSAPPREESVAGQDVGSSAGGANVRVRTLADQRRDEENEQRRRGTQLYNGMGLNVQPRKDDDDDKGRR